MKNAEVGKMLWCMNSFQLIVPLVRWAKKIGKAKKKSPADNMYQYLQGSAGYVGGLFHGAFVIK